jgi:predicted ABC-type sugar transport system permease subunit
MSEPVGAELERNARAARAKARRSAALRTGGFLAGLVVLVVVVNGFAHGAFLTPASISRSAR